MTKQELRPIYLDKRKKLTPAACAQFNLQLYHHFFSSFDLSFIKVLHTYIPLEKNNEPDTWPLIDRIRREFPQVRISVPRVAGDGNLENFYFEGLHQLQKTTWGIQEPKQGVPTPSDKIDMVVVPLLVFDKSGQRVGYGKGFYDKFLKECRKDCKKVGLSFFEGVDTISDPNEYDVKLDGCVTPTGLVVF
ncbi:MAG: 5-formyltetrahydrofolate cyclo-ligase [Bacteroidota bacterium]